MDNTKDKSSRSSSKINLNESSLPLLSDDEATLKVSEGTVAIEMVRSGEDQEKDTNVEEKEEDTQADGKKDSKEEKEKKKKEKEKQKKEKKEKTHKRRSSLADKLTAGLNLLDRDDRNVNDHVNIVFEDVLAEPDANHGFDLGWQLAFVLFTGTKLWVYRIFSAILAIPCGIVWGILFSVLSLFNVWIITPTLRVYDVLLRILNKLWGGLIRAFLDPLFQSVGHIFSKFSATNKHPEV